MAEDDHALLDRWRDGDAEAGNALFRRHFASVRRFFRNKVTADDVEDLIQRTFMACVEGQARFRREASFRTFLFAVARNQLYKFFRDSRSRNRHLDPDLGVSSVIALGMTPSSVAAAKQEHEILLCALQRVSVEEQTLLELAYWEGLSGPDIAEVFEISHAAVRTRLHRARVKLQEIIEQLRDPKSSFDLDEVAKTLRAL